MSTHPQNEILAQLKGILSTLESINGRLVRESNGRVNKSIKEELETTIKSWFSTTSTLSDIGFDNDLFESCDAQFKELSDIVLQATRNTKCKNIIKNIIPQIKEIHSIVLATRFEHMKEIDEMLSEVREIPDLKDAIRCARLEIYKGSLVLGWGAAMLCIRIEIKKLGFEKIKQICHEMVKGKNKNIQIRNISNFSELQDAPDKYVLQMAKHCNIIDKGQYGILESYMNMRHASAHPSNVIITPESLRSFYSELNEIIFSKFKEQDYSDVYTL